MHAPQETARPGKQSAHRAEYREQLGRTGSGRFGINPLHSELCCILCSGTPLGIVYGERVRFVLVIIRGFANILLSGLSAVIPDEFSGGELGEWAE